MIRAEEKDKIWMPRQNYQPKLTSKADKLKRFHFFFIKESWIHICESILEVAGIEIDKTWIGKWIDPPISRAGLGGDHDRCAVRS